MKCENVTSTDFTDFTLELDSYSLATVKDHSAALNASLWFDSNVTNMSKVVYWHLSNIRNTLTLDNIEKTMLLDWTRSLDLF